MPDPAFLAIVAGLASTTAILSQSQTRGSDVVVTAKAKPTPARLREAAEYLRKTGALRNERQLARWTDPICIRVVGVGSEPATFVKDSIEQIAKATGVRVDRRGCQPNIVISFTDDGAQLARQIHKRAVDQMSEASPDLRRGILTGDAGIRWWYSTETRGSDGRPLITGPAIAAPLGGENGTSVLPDKPTLNAYTSSTVATYAVRTLSSAAAIVDVEKVAGFSLRTVAHYLAMVTLAEIYAQDPPPQESILGAFADKDTSKALTATDRAFLAALYRVPLNRAPRYQRDVMLAKFVDGAP